MTLEVYNQLQQRVKREHGASFDRLIREARERLHGSQEPPPGDSTPNSDGVCAPVCVPDAKTPPTPRPPRRPGRGQNLAISRENGGQRRRDSASGHKCFQSCALPTELSRRWPIFDRQTILAAPQRLPSASGSFPRLKVRQRIDRIATLGLPAADPNLQVQVRTGG